MNMDVPLLNIRRLSKSFGGVRALQQVNLEVHQGEILSIIGPNGSGKTTLFNLVSGIYRPDDGEIVLQAPGREPACLVGLKPHKITAHGIGRTFQNIRLFANMTVIENVMVGMHSRTFSGPVGAVLRTKATRDEEQRVVEEARELLYLFPQLPALMNEHANVLSYADRKRLEVARALACQPVLVMLDEPAAGMNPQESRAFINDLKRLRDMGYTLMVIEHDMTVVKGLSDRVIAFDYGEKIAEGSFEEVQHNELVIEAYLGRKHHTA